MLTVPNLSESSMKRIFNSILGGFLEISFGEEFTKLTSPIVNATTLAYNWCCKELLPTPAKTHYTFNLRDLAKVVQGVLQANPKSVKHPDELALIWCHEAQRVFCDRLIDTDDKAMFLKLLSEVTQSELHQDIAPEVLGDTLFGDYECQDPSDRKNMYKHVTDMDNLQRLLLEYQEDYVINTMKPMDLVFFKDCVAHLSRCCRVLRQPRGCAMLVGVGGSGRSSVAKLATHMSTTEDGDDYTLFTIEVGRGYGLTQFREDIKELLFKCGIEGKPHTLQRLEQAGDNIDAAPRYPIVSQSHQSFAHVTTRHHTATGCGDRRQVGSCSRRASQRQSRNGNEGSQTRKSSHSCWSSLPNRNRRSSSRASSSCSNKRPSQYQHHHRHRQRIRVLE